MDFLKKNWGLLLCSVICIAVFVVLIIKCFGARSAYMAAEQEVQEHNDFFNKVNKTNLTVTAEDGELKNRDIAEANARIVAQHYQAMLSDCAERYKITPDLSEMRRISSTKFREMIEERISVMGTRVLKAKINWMNGEKVGDVFNELFDAGKMVEDSRRKQQVLRNVEIYDRVVDMIVNSGVKTVIDFDLPREYKDEEKGYYRSTPMVLSLQGTSAQLQAFMNDMTYYKNLFCVIKSMGMELVDLDVPDVVFSPYMVERYNVKAGREDGVNPAAGPGMTGIPGESRSSKRASRRENTMNMGGPGMGMGGSQKEEFTTIRRNRMVGTDLGAGSDSARSGMGGMGPAMDTGRRSSRRDSLGPGMERTTSRRSTPVMGPGMGPGMEGMNGMPNLWHFGEPKRQDYLVFANKRIFQLDLVVEIIEFNEPEITEEAEAEEEQAEPEVEEAAEEEEAEE